MTLSEILEQYNALTESINSEYSEYMGKIATYESDLTELSGNASGNTSRFITRQKNIIEKKIGDTRAMAEEKLNEKLDVLENWLTGRKSEAAALETAKLTASLEAF